jgi:ribosomal protein L11 methylase PrmA
MAAPKGNRFWELRSKHGRDKIITDPVALWESACEYFSEVEDNPLIEIDYKGKDADKVELEHPRPFQKDMLALYCHVDWRTIEALKKVSEDFLQVVTRIEKTIASQKFEGAAVGFFNPLIIARDLGLTDKQEVKNTQPIQIMIDKDDANL